MRGTHEKTYLDRDDLGDVDTWPYSKYPVQGCSAVGGWGDLQLNTASAGLTCAKLIM